MKKMICAFLTVILLLFACAMADEVVNVFN